MKSQKGTKKTSKKTVKKPSKKATKKPSKKATKKPSKKATKKPSKKTGGIYSKAGEQYHLHLMPGDVGEYVIIPGDPKRCEKIAQYFDDPKFVAENREFTTYTGKLLGKKVSVCSTGIGGPSAAIAVEELANVGAKYFIRVGTCGGMRLDVKTDDIVIASGAVRMEGTSREYAPIEWPAMADYYLTTALRNASKKLNYNYHIGVVECKDSFYGQHAPAKSAVWYELTNKWDAWCRLGCIASEMESAALFVVANVIGVRAATVLHVVANQERRKKGLKNPVSEDTDKAIKVAVEAIKLLIAENRSEGTRSNKLFKIM